MHYKKYLSNLCFSASINCIARFACIGGVMLKQLKELISASKTQKEIAEACDVSQQAVNQWIKNNQIPARRVRVVAKITGIPAHILNSDVFSEGDDQIQPELTD